jgi:hypothetical protein
MTRCPASRFGRATIERITWVRGSMDASGPMMLRLTTAPPPMVAPHSTTLSCTTAPSSMTAPASTTQQPSRVAEPDTEARLLMREARWPSPLRRV